jgi:hypothetical protein
LALGWEQLVVYQGQRLSSACGTDLAGIMFSDTAL